MEVLLRKQQLKFWVFLGLLELVFGLYDMLGITALFFVWDWFWLIAEQNKEKRS